MPGWAQLLEVFARTLQEYSLHVKDEGIKPRVD